jgi:hypothetical protein
MTDRGNQPALTGWQDRSALAQRALACELAGELDRAVALVRCIQRRDTLSAATGGSPEPPHRARRESATGPVS